MDLEAIQNAACQIMDRTRGAAHMLARRIQLRAQGYSMNADPRYTPHPKRGYKTREEWKQAHSNARHVAWRNRYCWPAYLEAEYRNANVVRLVDPLDTF